MHSPPPLKPPQAKRRRLPVILILAVILYTLLGSIEISSRGTQIVIRIWPSSFQRTSYNPYPVPENPTLTNPYGSNPDGESLPILPATQPTQTQPEATSHPPANAIKDI